MSHEVLNIGMLDLSSSNESETKTTVIGSKIPAPRSVSDNVKLGKGSLITKKVTIRKNIKEKNSSKVTPRKRSLTMTDIRNKVEDNNRTPRKQMKQDSCSTTDYSPRVSDEYPAAEMMLTIRRRELQIRTFSKIFYSLWQKHRYLAENFRDEVNQLHLQKSFLINLRDKESERREEITKVAEKQKTEIIDLTEQLSQLKKEREILQDFCQKLQQEYNGSIDYYNDKSSADFNFVHDENQQIILKVKQITDLMDARFIGLKRTLRVVEEIDNKAQEHLVTFEDINHQRADAIELIENFTNSNKILQDKLKTKDENENKLKETINELRNSLENASIKNSDLKSQIKDLELQLEFAEYQINERNIRRNLWSTWSGFARKAARLSTYILFQVGLFSTF